MKFSIIEISIVNFIHFQVKTFSPVLAAASRKEGINEIRKWSAPGAW